MVGIRRQPGFWTISLLSAFVIFLGGHRDCLCPELGTSVHEVCCGSWQDSGRDSCSDHHGDCTPTVSAARGGVADHLPPVAVTPAAAALDSGLNGRTVVAVVAVAPPLPRPWFAGRSLRAPPLV